MAMADNSRIGLRKEIDTLLRISAVLNSSLDTGQILKSVMKVAKDFFRLEAGSVLLLDEKGQYLHFFVAMGNKSPCLDASLKIKLGEGIAGYVAKTGQALLIPDVGKEPRFCKRIDKKTGFITKSILCVPIIFGGKILGVVEILNSQRAFCEEDEYLLSIFANQIATALENARNHKAMLEKERIQNQLEIAQQIQKAYLPRARLRHRAFDFFARSHPAYNLCGDFFSYSKLNENRFSFILADVSGKGIPASLMMIRALHEYDSFVRDFKRAGEFLDFLNKFLCMKAHMGMFLSCLHLVLDIKDQSLEIANGGHPPVFLKRGSRILPLYGYGGPVLGVTPDVNYITEKIPLRKKDEIAAATDGVLEMIGGEKGFDATAIPRRLSVSLFDLSRLDRFFRIAKREPAGLNDDLTAILIRFYGRDKS